MTQHPEELDPATEREIIDGYKRAFAEWIESGEAALWDVTVGDGIEPDDWSEERAAQRARRGSIQP